MRRLFKDVARQAASGHPHPHYRIPFFFLFDLFLRGPLTELDVRHRLYYRSHPRSTLARSSPL